MKVVCLPTAASLEQNAARVLTIMTENYHFFFFFSQLEKLLQLLSGLLTLVIALSACTRHKPTEGKRRTSCASNTKYVKLFVLSGFLDTCSSVCEDDGGLLVRSSHRPVSTDCQLPPPTAEAPLSKATTPLLWHLYIHINACASVLFVFFRPVSVKR